VFLGVGDLTDISLQTEVFAKNHGKGLSMNEPLSSSSRSSSYSSIGSNNSSSAGGRDKKYQASTPSPTDIKQKSPITAHPGTIGGNKQGTGGRKNPWNQSPGSTTSSQDG